MEETTTIGPLDITALTAELCEAMNKLSEAKQEALTQETAARETLARYHALFDQVAALQKTINETITVCLNLRK